MGRADELDELLAALADPETTAVVVTGPAGAGKTRLARSVTGAAAVPPLWWQATRAAAGVPLGVLAGIVDDDGLDAVGLHRRVAGLVVDAGGVVVVDDAPHLDARSADVLRRLVDAGKATVVATARDGEAVPEWLEWLWLGDRTHHLVLAPLDAPATEQLVELVLPTIGSTEQSRVVASLLDRTEGNALFLRELLVDLRRRIDAGEPVTVDLEAPPHLLRVLETRQKTAGEDVLAVLRDVAVSGSLPVAVVQGRHQGSAVAAAERAAYVVVDDEGRRATARPAHPLQAEAALAAMTASERRLRTIEVASAVLDEPTATVAERLAATTALLDAGSPVTTDALVQAARTAFSALDHDLAARLARAAIAAGDPFEAKVVLGAAHSGANRADEAEAALRDALASAVTDDQRARAAGRISVHLVAHGGRVDEAAALLDEVIARLADPAARTFLDADRAKLASIRGDLRSVAVGPDDDADDLAVLNTSIVGAYARAMAGDADGCRATIARALPLADAHRAVLPWSGELVRFSGPFAALVAEGPVAAHAEAQAALAAAIADDGPTTGTWSFLTGFTAAVAGNLRAAAGSLDAADAELDGHDLIGARPLAVAARAWVAAQVGDVDLARSLLDRSVDAASVDGRVRAQVAVADAWCDVHEVSSLTASAIAKVVSAARDAAEGGQVVTAVIVINELVRLGAPREALAALAPIARSAPPSWIVSVVRDRAEAEAASDRSALARLVRHVDRRWPVMTAELEARRAHLASQAGDDVAAARSSLVAVGAMRSLGPDVPWTLAGVASPLTEREAQVAAAVASGSTNRQVAEQAGVSVRTVENQLQSTYRKLGVGARSDLADLLSSRPSP